MPVQTTTRQFNGCVCNYGCIDQVQITGCILVGVPEPPAAYALQVSNCFGAFTRSIGGNSVGGFILSPVWYGIFRNGVYAAPVQFELVAYPMIAPQRTAVNALYLPAAPV